MARIVHQGKEEALGSVAFANVAEVIDEWNRTLGRQGRVITRVRVDEHELDSDELENLELMRLDEIAEIGIESSTCRDVAIDMLESCSQYCTAIDNASAEIAGLLRVGRIDEANEHLAQLADSFSFLVNAEAAAIDVIGGAARELLELSAEFMPWLKRITDAQMAHDWVRAADYLEYEISPLLGDWKGRLHDKYAELSGPTH